MAETGKADGLHAITHTRFRTNAEENVGRNVGRIFEGSRDSIEVKLENFTKYVRRQHLKRFLAFYELFKLVLPLKGSVVECGIFRGFGVMAWAKLSAMLEPENLTRRIYGFDTFEGFPVVSSQDRNHIHDPAIGELYADSYHELEQLICEFDRDRFLGHISKVELIKGDMAETIPSFLESHGHLLISLLYMDCDLYQPTKIALSHFLPRMSKGAVIAFDELDNPLWPGETQAMLDAVGADKLRLRRLEWDPYIAFAIIGD
jgi:Macrocin-O-methyltransferase (TylF)